MSLEHGLLGYLSLKPMTGYDLKKLIDSSARHFWSAEHPQIYKALQTLLDKSWVRIYSSEPGRKLEKKIYAITPEGEAELCRWLEFENYSESVIRNPVMMQFFFSGIMPEDKHLELFRKELEFSQKKMSILTKVYDDTVSEFSRLANVSSSDRKLKSMNLTYKWGLMRLDAYIKWLESCVAELK